jgi:class 3 adenylate cyclase
MRGYGGLPCAGMAAEHGGPITRGFLFADLRGYTYFVERQGAAVAAELLTRYRALAREAIGRFGGAEIKTEGDSFYVGFDSVSSAVRCGSMRTVRRRGRWCLSSAWTRRLPTELATVPC